MSTMVTPWSLTADEADDLRSRMCGGKIVHTYEVASRRAWYFRNVEDQGVNAYPCPFHHGHPGCWHVGHPPNVERMRLLARYLRFGADGP